MIKDILVFTLSILLFHANAQSIEGYTLMGTKTYEYDAHQCKVEKYTYTPEGKLSTFVHYLHDVHGNKIGTLKYSSDSILLARYVFDTNNVRIKNTKYDFVEDAENRKTYKYDDQGLAKYVEKNYNTEGDYTSRKSFDKGGLITSESQYKYVYDDNRILEKRSYSVNNELQSLVTYSYDKNGCKTSSTSEYTSTRRAGKKRTYKYNEKGQCIGSSVYTKDKEH